MDSNLPSAPAFLDRPVERTAPLTWETVLVVFILILTVLSRFYDLGSRAMSHDEINHVVPSYDYSQGRGYRYDPITHGPLQFHLVALSFFFFGDSDFTARIPAALFSCASAALGMLLFRRYLGRKGALVAGVLFLISPYMLFYGRYTRNEAFIVLWGLLGLWAILRYLESGSRRYLFALTLVTALHFTDKATSYIFVGEQMAFLGFYLLDRLLGLPWPNPRLRLGFGLTLIAAAALGGLGLVSGLSRSVFFLLLIPAVLFLLGAGFLFQRGPGWLALREQRSFRLLMLLVGLTLPLLGSLPLKILGYNPLNLSGSGVALDLAALVPLALLGLGAGYLAAGRDVWKHFALFFAIFIPLYTSLFSNPGGLAGGLFGALGYWMDQQAVDRGNQPWFYYLFLQIPLYEYLPALGTLGALVVAARRRLWQTAPGQPFQPAQEEPNPVPAPALFLFWSASSLAAFTLAGEKMPWLTIHIALPMILACAWFIAWLLEAHPLLPWKRALRASSLLGLGLLAILTARTAFRAAFLHPDLAIEYLVYAHSAPDPKRLLSEIEDLSRKTTGGLDMVVAYDNNVRYPYWWYLRHYPNRLDYDVNPTSDLRKAAVVMVGEPNFSKVDPLLKDDYVSSEGIRLWWPNMDYWRLKWDSIAAEYTKAHPPAPGQSAPPLTLPEYLGGVWQHLSPFFSDPRVREAIWQIWLNRDFSLYAATQQTPSDYTLSNWRPAERMRIYIRKDVLARVYGFSYTPPAPPAQVDPYQDKLSAAVPELIVGQAGTQPGQFQAPRGLALAPDGSLYAADSRNHRIQHLAPDGKTVLQTWGKFADVAQSAAPGGTFNEPWGVAVGPDGSVYVTDTWNHRVQKFDAQGKFLSMWGSFGQATTPDAFWGPRGIAVDSSGRVYVSDTGNKRVVIFDANGRSLAQFGSAGSEAGQFNEPVGLALDSSGRVYVADTWNRRIQVFQDQDGKLSFEPLRSWTVAGWLSDSLDNKPFLALAPNGDVLSGDPEACRILDFSPEGALQHAWSACQAGGSVFSGLAVGPAGQVWVSDAAQNSLLRFANLIAAP